MLTVTDQRKRFFAQGSLITALAVLASTGLLLVWFLNHPYQNSSGSSNPPEMESLLPIVEAKQQKVTPKPGRLRARPAS